MPRPAGAATAPPAPEPSRQLLPAPTRPVAARADDEDDRDPSRRRRWEDEEDDGPKPLRSRRRRGRFGPTLVGKFFRLELIDQGFVLLAAVALAGTALAFFRPAVSQPFTWFGLVITWLAALWFLAIASEDGFMPVLLGVVLFVGGAFLAGWCARRVSMYTAVFVASVPCAGLYPLATNFAGSRRTGVLHLLGLLFVFGPGFAVAFRDTLAQPAAPAGFTPPAGNPPAADRPAPPVTSVRPARRPAERPPEPPPPADRPVEVTPAIPATPAARDAVFLTDLTPFDVQSGPWPVTLGHTGSPDRYPVKVGDKVSEHGIGMHPPDAPGLARVSFTLGGKGKRFKGWAALNVHHAETRSPVRFTVYGDGRALWEAAEVTRKGGPVEFDLDVAGVQILTLETRAAGSHFNAYAVWFEPRLEK